MKFPSIKGFDEEAFNKYLKNTGLLMLGRVGSLAIKMAIGIKVANYLLADNYGVLNTSYAYVFLFAAIAGLGLDSFIVKELHQFPENRDRILGTAFFLKLGAGLICIPLIYISWQIFPLSNVSYQLVFILSFIGSIQSLTIVDAFFQAEVKSKYIMQVQIIGNIISAMIKLLLIFSGASLIMFVYAFTLDFLLISIGYFFAYQRKGRNVFNWSFDRQLSKKLLSFSWPLIISGLMGTIYMKIDQIMLKEMLFAKGAAAAGAYATVVTFSEALNFVPIAIVTSVFPAILNAKRDDTERYKKRVQDLFDIMVWISLCFSILITLASPYIYKLFDKEAYAAAAPVLAVHVWGSLFVFLGVAGGQILIAEGFGKLTFIRTGIGAIINILLNLILIPKMGMMGTAIATVIAYFSAAFVVIFIPRTRQQGIMMLKSLFLVSLFQKLVKR